MVFRKNFIYFLILITFAVWLSVFSIDNQLHIVACDVGQGDAILIQKNTTQILIDGGPDNSVLNCLGKHMPFWDKKLELVILTHPQEDHYGGLVDVFKNYKVNLFGEYNTESSNQGYQVLKNIPTPLVTLSKGTKLRLGMIYLDILHPSGNNQSIINNKQTSNANDDGVVVLLKYAQFKALFTADVENKVSDKLSELPEIQNLNYLKVNHHGSKNGLSQKLLDTVDPEIAVISVGKKNRYGHPHEEVIKILGERDIKILRTDLEGDVEVVTDGISYWTKK